MSAFCPPARRIRAARPGFSLLELMLVLAIIGVLMAVVTINVVGGANRAKITATKATLSTIQTAIKSYIVQFSAPPSNLQALVTEKYLDDTKKLKDGWDSDLLYEVRQGNADRPYALISAGQDKTPGNEDDIDVWTMQK